MREGVQFISNSKSSNHKKVISKWISEADTIWIATAFLKESGLALLLPELKKAINKGKKVTIIAGQNFGLTDPSALLTLFDLSKAKPNATLYLDRAIKPTQVFHPKLFLFEIGEKRVIVSGSANVTSGGLQGNHEASLLVETNKKGQVWKDAIEYFDGLIENADLVNRMLIGRYDSFHSDQEKVRRNQKAVADKSSEDYSFDYDNLRKYLKDYKKKYGDEEFEMRVDYYDEAREVLDEISDSKRLSQKRFEALLDSLVVGDRLWYSGSLYRHRKSVYLYKNEFRDLVRFIRKGKDLSAEEVFDGAKKMVKPIKGAAINYVTEIMMTYNPDRFANLNRNPITVLNQEAGVYFKSHSSSFSGIDYENYCYLLYEIAEKLELKNMLEVDSFFNDIYWKIKKAEE